jgi:hypothetical protein
MVVVYLDNKSSKAQGTVVATATGGGNGGLGTALEVGSRQLSSCPITITKFDVYIFYVDVQLFIYLFVA